VIFVGKSLVGHGGQNPIEPAKLGSAILHGPHVGNFLEVYAALDEKGGAIEVKDADALASTLTALLTDPALLRRTAEASREIVGALGGASDKIMQALEHYIAHMIVSEH
jgi:3-deoxy-D-manno-octulosonic-acid transferase